MKVKPFYEVICETHGIKGKNENYKHVRVQRPKNSEEQKTAGCPQCRKAKP